MAPALLRIFRERLKAGADAEYRVIEEETARIAVALTCPHPYLGAESLTGPKEVWWFNGYASPDEIQQVDIDYKTNAALMDALQQQSRRKAGLTLEPIDALTKHRSDLTRGAEWILGHGRFLVITTTTSQRAIDGTVFEALDGTRFIITPARTREEADANAAAAGADTHIFAVRPNWSMPASEWVAADPEFWR